MHSSISWPMITPEIQDILKESKERQEKLFEKAEKKDLQERWLDFIMASPKKWRDKIVMQKVKEGVYRGPFEEFYPTLRKYGAEPEALKTFWNELGDIPVDDDGIIQESFLWWPKGSDREDIWRWFDEKYPGGVVRLMGLEEFDSMDTLDYYNNKLYIRDADESKSHLCNSLNAESGACFGMAAACGKDGLYPVSKKQLETLGYYLERAQAVIMYLREEVNRLEEEKQNDKL